MSARFSLLRCSQTHAFSWLVAVSGKGCREDVPWSESSVEPGSPFSSITKPFYSLRCREGGR